MYATIQKFLNDDNIKETFAHIDDFFAMFN